MLRRLKMQKITYLVDFLFEALLQHLVGFVKHDRLELREVDIASLDVVEHATTGTDEEVDTAAQCSRLVVNVDTTIDGQ